MLLKLKNYLREQVLKAARAHLYVTLDLFVDGKKTLHKVGDSLTGNFLQVLYIGFSEFQTVDWIASTFNGGNNTKAKAITGLQATFASTGAPMEAHALAGDAGKGIIFGTGNTATTPQDFVLQTPIANGGGAGQLNYLASGSIQAPVAVGAVTSFVLQRIATNTSGGTITVSEVGIYTQNVNDANMVCIFREVVNQAVLNGQTLTCQITFNVTT